jgi:small-conductance mechanosensitive channel
MLVWMIATLGAALLGFLVYEVGVTVVQRALRPRPLATTVVRRLRTPGWIFLTAAIIGSALGASPLGDDARTRSERAAALVMIASVAWLVVRLVTVLIDEAEQRLRTDAPDNLRARTMQTQLTILRRVVTVSIVIIAAASMLWTFNEVRALGASILASAGILGIVVGIGARPTIGNLFAGIQIAFSAPIRLDDVVVVDGEWGRVEEITLVHVVVRTWDERRLMLPCVYFLENTFQNWTRRTSQILAPVELHLDHCVDVDGIRDEVERILADEPLWDGRTSVVQLTATESRTVTVRVLLSAASASNAWDLRCAVRERLLRYLRDHQPDALPRLRLTTPSAFAV